MARTTLARTWRPETGARSPQELLAACQERQERLAVVTRAESVTRLRTWLFAALKLMPRTDPDYMDAVCEASEQSFVSTQVHGLKFAEAVFWTAWVRRYAREHGIDLRPLKCWFRSVGCPAAVVDEAAAAAGAWTPGCWGRYPNGQEEFMAFPVCPRCQETRLSHDETTEPFFNLSDLSADRAPEPQL